MFEKSCRKLFPYVVGLAFHKQQSEKEPPQISVGTGTIINQQGLILTANHVLKDASWDMKAARNFVAPRPPKFFKGPYQTVGRFPEHDLALIHIPNLSLDGLKKPMDWLFSGLVYGSPVGSFGYPDPRISQKGTDLLIDMILRFKSYFIAGLDRLPPSTTYTLDSFAYGGHSGGPVFDREGQIFGVIIETELHIKKGYEISYCRAADLSNIQSELIQAQRS